MVWLQLQPRPDYIDYPDNIWRQEAIEGGRLCPSCRGRSPQDLGSQLDLKLLERPFARPFGDADVCIVAQREFVASLDDIGGDLMAGSGVGRVILPNGRASEKYVTLSPSSAVLLRGGPASTKSCCRVCRRLHYFPMPWKSRHVIKGTFDEARRLHATQVGVLVVRTEVWDQIPDVFKKKIRAWPLPVKEKPEDGMEALPQAWP
jgi:hypothetical protein